ncbi:cell division protein ZapD [Salinisphaera orenii]|uniref:cell division protein ZapD n=1 Tax=Salinisphaera orenii TaxID=856731 RepID=UPI0013A63B5E
MVDGPHAFEQPLNERTRGFLRLEYLFERLTYHRADTSSWGRRATLDVLLDVLSVMAYFDVNGEVSKALGQRYAQIDDLRFRNQADPDTANELLAQIDDLGRRIQRVPANFAGYLLRDDELLYNLNNRRPIAGGSCGFDIPGYQNWLALPHERIEADLDAWCTHLAVFESAIGLLLKLLRDGTQPRTKTAENAMFIYNTPPETQMIRVLINDANVFPQISAGRHRATIRFMTRTGQAGRVRPLETNLDFQLACCSQ